jgi:hypothetical protein
LSFHRDLARFIFDVVAESRQTVVRTFDHFVQVAGQHPIHRMANEHEFEKGLIGKLEIF